MSIGEKALAYARLLRLSNGPTAVADVWMGYAVVSGGLTPSWRLTFATAASLLAYHGGMALNDAVDVDEDIADSRDRPVVRGDVSLTTALLLAEGMLLGSIASAACVNWGAGAVSLLLAIAIGFYNSRYKATAVGPLMMGFCRFLNVLLGVSASLPVLDTTLGKTPVEGSDGFGGALLIGTYIIGVTCFARDEARQPSRWRLTMACSVCFTSVLAAASTLWRPPTIDLTLWYLTWAVVALIATRGMVAGILQPTPRNIGRGVGIAIQGLVVIDAVLAAFYAGPVAGLAILALLPVTLLLARWIPQT